MNFLFLIEDSLIKTLFVNIFFNVVIIVADFLKLEENDSFWEIYDKYEAERKDLGHNRIKIIRD